MSVKVPDNIYGIGKLAAKIAEIIETGERAWQCGLMSGFSGNISVRLARDAFLLTAAGSCKGQLRADDLVIVNEGGERVWGSKNASSEFGLHVALYAQMPDCAAILHTHPPNMQSLEIILQGGELARDFLNLPLYESQYWRKRLVFGDNGVPGDKGLAAGAKTALAKLSDMPLPKAVWLPLHGLCAAAATLTQCLGISEELEHLAKVQLASWEGKQ